MTAGSCRGLFVAPLHAVIKGTSLNLDGGLLEHLHERLLVKRERREVFYILKDALLDVSVHLPNLFKSRPKFSSLFSTGLALLLLA